MTGGKIVSLLERLENNLNRYNEQFEEVNNDSQFRNIAFGSAGYLSKASKSRLYAQREKIGRICDKIQITKLCIKIVKGETFNFQDIQDTYNNFLAVRNPEMRVEFATECFRLCAVSDMINIILEVHQAPYRKNVLKYKLKYQNRHGGIIEIPLGKAQ